jgi:hypothetical protein
MTPQERDLLTNLVTRLRQSPSQDVDQEALKMINDLVRDKPDTPYVLAQTVLIQDYALHQAQARIADLEQQVKNQPPHKEGGFLSSLFGSGKDPQPTPQPAPRPQPQPNYQAQPTYPQPAAGPWGQAPVSAAPQMFAQQSGGPSFLRSAATTAAGVAGGALLFQGIESLFHGGMGGGMGGFGGAGFGGFGGQPGLTETVVNNYYDNPAGGAGGQGGFLPDQASFDRVFDQGGQSTPADANFDQGFDQGGVTDAGFDQGGGFDGGGDFGGGDLGGGGGDDFI